jgi:hypothetical protein
MKASFLLFIILTVLIYSCNPFPGPRNVDWKKEWDKNQSKLKQLALDILRDGGKNYNVGINSFPNEFEYPFDDGFAISPVYVNGGVTDSLDTKNITIKFYVDRGLLDHYSAIIFTNDSSAIGEFDRSVENGGNDFKIEPGWYMIND